MIQSYRQLAENIQSFNQIIEEKPAHIQKVFSTAYVVEISIRLPGETQYLVLGRGRQVEGLLFENQRIPASHRRQDKFLSYLRKVLVGSLLIQLEMDQRDRAFCLHYQRWGRRNKLYFFYNGKSLSFFNFFYSQKKSRFLLFEGWSNTYYEDSTESSFARFDSIGRRDMPNKMKMNDSFSIENILELEVRHMTSNKAKNKKLKRLKRKFEFIEADIERVRGYSELEKLVENQEAVVALPQRTTIEQIKIKFASNEFYKRRNQLFQKIKSLRRAESLLSLRLEETRQKLSIEEGNDHHVQLKVISPKWWSEQKDNILSGRGELENCEFFNFPSFKLGVGKSAQGNDSLRTKFANKDDWWFHLAQDKGSHLILKGEEVELSEQVFDIAVSVLIEFSRLDYSTAELVYTRVRYLKGVRGSAGKVIYKKEKRVYAKRIDWRHYLS